jgi:hypothetical protein
VLALILGVLLLLPGLGLLGGGGTGLWAHYLDRSDGFVVSPRETFGSAGHALVSDRIDVSAVPGWLPVPGALGAARLEVTGAGPADVFVGVAPAADARAYLDGVARTVVDGLGFDAPPTARDQLPGGDPTGPPTEQGFWIASASGQGTQEVSWDPTDGDWMFVVMNADGSPGVDVEARIGAEVPALAGLGWGVFVAGLLVTVGAVGLLVRGLRQPWDPAVPYRQPRGDWRPRRPPAAHAGMAQSDGRRPDQRST